MVRISETGGGALRVGRKLGTTCGSGPDSVCVCFMYLYCLSSSCVLCTQCYQSIHSRQKFQLTYWEKKYLLFIIDDQHFSKFFLFFPLIFESSSDCGPFLICTSVFSQAPGSRIFFFFIKISYLECMFNFRTPWHVLLLF